MTDRSDRPSWEIRVDVGPDSTTKGLPSGVSGAGPPGDKRLSPGDQGALPGRHRRGYGVRVRGHLAVSPAPVLRALLQAVVRRVHITTRALI